MYRQDYRINYKMRKLALKKGSITSVIFIQFLGAVIFSALVLCIKFIPAFSDINFYLTNFIELDIFSVIFDFFKGLFGV